MDPVSARLLRAPKAYLFSHQCADSIISTLGDYQNAARRRDFNSPAPTAVDLTGSELMSNDEPIAYVIEAAKVVKLCAQHQKVCVRDSTHTAGTAD